MYLISNSYNVSLDLKYQSFFFLFLKNFIYVYSKINLINILNEQQRECIIIKNYTFSIIIYRVI